MKGGAAAGQGVHREPEAVQPPRQHRRCQVARDPQRVHDPLAAERRGARRRGSHRRRCGCRSASSTSTTSSRTSTRRWPRRESLSRRHEHGGGLGRVQHPAGRPVRPGRARWCSSPARRWRRVEVAYETYGTLDADGANAVFVCHALTGDAHAAGHHGDPARRGWWDNLIGPGRPLDTDRFFVICPNLLGGCSGDDRALEHRPAHRRPYGLRLPAAHRARPRAPSPAAARPSARGARASAIGGSLGGMQALQWALDRPRRG